MSALRIPFQCGRCRCVATQQQPLVAEEVDGVTLMRPAASEAAPRCPSCGRPMKVSPFDRVDGKRLHALLDELWTPRLRSLGLEPRQPGSWAEPGDRLMRRMVGFAQLKGAGAIAHYGFSLAFVPTPGRNELVYHRTFKSAWFDVAQVYPPTYCAVRPVPGEFPELSLFNPLIARNTLAGFIGPLTDSAGRWFAALPDLATLERYLRECIRDGLYPNLGPRPQWALAFIAAARGNNAEARQLLRSAPRGFLELHREFEAEAFEKARRAWPPSPNLSHCLS